MKTISIKHSWPQGLDYKLRPPHIYEPVCWYTKHTRCCPYVLCTMSWRHTGLWRWSSVQSRHWHWLEYSGWHHIPNGKRHWYWLRMKLGEPHNQSEHGAEKRVRDLTGSPTAAVQSTVTCFSKWAIPLHHHLQFYFSKHILKMIPFKYIYTDTHFFWDAVIILILSHRSPTFLILLSKHNLLTDFMEHSFLKANSCSVGHESSYILQNQKAYYYIR